ncbi:hypothetical protein DL769_010490 [Monosporascus sp. CRB-8-3]|nr:hypothetical protein DL769_010490 [Monosporascus sp. CRB-8-3]
MADVIYRRITKEQAIGAAGAPPYQNNEGDLPPDFFTWPIPSAYLGIFSTSNGTKPWRPAPKLTRVTRPKIWDAAKIQSFCDEIRTLFWAHSKHLQPLQSYYELYKYFDAHDIFHCGPLNLWNVIHHLISENRMVLEDLKDDVMLHFDSWAANLLKDEDCRNRLRAWNQEVQNDILHCFHQQELVELDGMEIWYLPTIRHVFWTHYVRLLKEPVQPAPDAVQPSNVNVNVPSSNRSEEFVGKDILSATGSQESDKGAADKIEVGNKTVNATTIVDGTSGTAAHNAGYITPAKPEKEKQPSAQPDIYSMTAPVTVQLATPPNAHDYIMASLPSYPSWIVQPRTTSTAAVPVVPPANLPRQSPSNTLDVASLSGMLRATSAPPLGSATIGSNAGSSRNKRLQPYPGERHVSDHEQSRGCITQGDAAGQVPSSSHINVQRNGQPAPLMPHGYPQPVQQNVRSQYFSPPGQGSMMPPPPPPVYRPGMGYQTGPGAVSDKLELYAAWQPEPGQEAMHNMPRQNSSHLPHLRNSSRPWMPAGSNQAVTQPIGHGHPAAMGQGPPCFPYNRHIFSPRGLPAPVIHVTPTQQRFGRGINNNGPQASPGPQPSAGPGGGASLSRRSSHAHNKSNGGGNWQAAGTDSLHGPKSVYRKKDSPLGTGSQNKNKNITPHEGQPQPQQQQTQQLQRLPYVPPHQTMAGGGTWTATRRQSNESQYQNTAPFDNRRMSSGRYQHQHQRQASNASSRVSTHNQGRLESRLFSPTQQQSQQYRRGSDGSGSGGGVLYHHNAQQQRWDSTGSFRHRFPNFPYSDDPNCRNRARADDYSSGGVLPYYIRYQPCPCRFCHELDRSVYVSRINNRHMEEDIVRSRIETIFSKYGEIECVRITGKGRAALVRFVKQEPVFKAIRELDEKTIDGINADYVVKVKHPIGSQFFEPWTPPHQENSQKPGRFTLHGNDRPRQYGSPPRMDSLQQISAVQGPSEYGPGAGAVNAAPFFQVPIIPEEVAPPSSSEPPALLSGRSVQQGSPTVPDSSRSLNQPTVKECPQDKETTTQRAGNKAMTPTGITKAPAMSPGRGNVAVVVGDAPTSRSSSSEGKDTPLSPTEPEAQIAETVNAPLQNPESRSCDHDGARDDRDVTVDQTERQADSDSDIDQEIGYGTVIHRPDKAKYLSLPPDWASPSAHDEATDDSKTQEVSATGPTAVDEPAWLVSRNTQRKHWGNKKDMRTTSQIRQETTAVESAQSEELYYLPAVSYVPPSAGLTATSAPSPPTRAAHRGDRQRQTSTAGAEDNSPREHFRKRKAVKTVVSVRGSPTKKSVRVWKEGEPRQQRRDTTDASSAATSVLAGSGASESQQTGGQRSSRVRKQRNKNKPQRAADIHKNDDNDDNDRTEQPLPYAADSFEPSLNLKSNAPLPGYPIGSDNSGSQQKGEGSKAWKGKGNAKVDKEDAFVIQNAVINSHWRTASSELRLEQTLANCLQPQQEQPQSQPKPAKGKGRERAKSGAPAAVFPVPPVPVPVNLPAVSVPVPIPTAPYDYRTEADYDEYYGDGDGDGAKSGHDDKSKHEEEQLENEDVPEPFPEYQDPLIAAVVAAAAARENEKQSSSGGASPTKHASMPSDASTVVFRGGVTTVPGTPQSTPSPLKQAGAGTSVGVSPHKLNPCAKEFVSSPKPPSRASSDTIGRSPEKQGAETVSTGPMNPAAKDTKTGKSKKGKNKKGKGPASTSATAGTKDDNRSTTATNSRPESRATERSEVSASSSGVGAADRHNSKGGPHGKKHYHKASSSFSPSKKMQVSAPDVSVHPSGHSSPTKRQGDTGQSSPTKMQSLTKPISTQQSTQSATGGGKKASLTTKPQSSKTGPRQQQSYSTPGPPGPPKLDNTNDWPGLPPVAANGNDKDKNGNQTSSAAVRDARAQSASTWGRSPRTVREASSSTSSVVVAPSGKDEEQKQKQKEKRGGWGNEWPDGERKGG